MIKIKTRNDYRYERLGGLQNTTILHHPHTQHRCVPGVHQACVCDTTSMNFMMITTRKKENKNFNNDNINKRKEKKIKYAIHPYF